MESLLQNLGLIAEIEMSSCKWISIIPIKKEIKSTNVACGIYTVAFPKYLLGRTLGMIFSASFTSGYSIIIGFNFESDNWGIFVAQLPTKEMKKEENSHIIEAETNEAPHVDIHFCAAFSW